MQRWLESHWYRKTFVSCLLLPLSWLFRIVTRLRRGYYQVANYFQPSLRVPVIVVGNITTGATGKTPLVIFLVRLLVSAGYRPGVVTRGYGGRAIHWPMDVTSASDPELAGDEPVLIARNTGCPVVAAPARRTAAKYLLKHHDCNVVLTDDGLQHYALQRDLEVAVIDGKRRHGNGYCLPAGPLRESVARLKKVDFIIVNGEAVCANEYTMEVSADRVSNLKNHKERSLANFNGAEVHAVAGIGHPERFFSLLETFGLSIRRHSYPDHHAFDKQDICFNDVLPVLMTEKDAVKCRRFATRQHWSVGIEATPNAAFQEQFLTRIRSLMHG